MRIIFILLLVALLVVICNQCHGQIYSSATSHEVLGIVSTETPKIQTDTVQLGVLPPGMKILRHQYIYQKVIIVLVSSLNTDWMLSMDWEWRCRVYTKDGSRVVLIPDEEFAILEKILPLIKKK